MKESGSTETRNVLKAIGTGVVSSAALSGYASAKGGGLQLDMASVRDATAECNDPQNTIAAGFVPEEGSVCGRGFHWGNPPLMVSMNVIKSKPAVLAHRVDDNGDPIVGAVEYAVPVAGSYADASLDIFEYADSFENAGFDPVQTHSNEDIPMSVVEGAAV